MEKAKKIVNEFLSNIFNDNLGVYSAQCAYYIFLSFMPFLILLLSLIQYFNISQETLYNIIKSVIPGSMEGAIFSIIEEVSSKSVTTTVVSVIITLWAARKGFYALNKGLNSVFEIKNVKLMYVKQTITSILNTIEFLVFIIISLALVIFGNTLTQEIYKIFNNAEYLGTVINFMKNIIIILILFLIFICIYKGIPRHKVTISSQIPGAVFSVVGWLCVSKVFSVYLDVFKNFASMYGSLTSVLLVLMWIYISMYIIFVGAEINKITQKNKSTIKEK